MDDIHLIFEKESFLEYLRSIRHHAWARKLRKEVKKGRIPISFPFSFNMINIAHDDWCPYLQDRGTCTCDPDIRLVESHHPVSNN